MDGQPIVIYFYKAHRICLHNQVMHQITGCSAAWCGSFMESRCFLYSNSSCPWVSGSLDVHRIISTLVFAHLRYIFWCMTVPSADRKPQSSNHKDSFQNRFFRTGHIPNRIVHSNPVVITHWNTSAQSVNVLVITTNNQEVCVQPTSFGGCVRYRWVLMSFVKTN